MVKKHSSSLKNTEVDDEQDASDVEMDPNFWHDILDFYFIRGRESRGREDDDLIFFVRKLVRGFFCATATCKSARTSISYDLFSTFWLLFVFVVKSLSQP